MYTPLQVHTGLYVLGMYLPNAITPIQFDPTFTDLVCEAPLQKALIARDRCSLALYPLGYFISTYTPIKWDRFCPVSTGFQCARLEPGQSKIGDTARYSTPLRKPPRGYILKVCNS